MATKTPISFFILTTCLQLIAINMVSCDAKKKKDVKPSTPSAGTSLGTDINPQSSGCLRLTQDDQDSWSNQESNPDDQKSLDPDAQTEKNAPATNPSDCAPAAPPVSDSQPSPKDTSDPEPQSTSTGTQTGATPQPSTQTPPPSPSNNPPPGDTSIPLYAVGPGIDGCKAQGKVWKAVDSSQPGKSGSCGDALVNFCCTQSDVLAKFSSSKSFLEPEFAKATSQGLILYGCSTDTTSKTTFHFAKYDGNNWAYRTLYITSKSETGTPPASCPNVSLSDLGYK